jgi:hypothetical protein
MTRPISYWCWHALAPLFALLCFAGCEEMSVSGSMLRSQLFHQVALADRYDFLWVMDNSDSMSDNRQFVAANLATFLNVLRRRKAIDFRMAVTTTDAIAHKGALVKSAGGLEVVSSQSADPTADFASIVQEIRTSSSAFWEQGLESAYQAIVKNGDRFRRPGTPLILIFLTDEEDYSCSAGCYGYAPETHLEDWVPHPLSRYTALLRGLQATSGQPTMVYPIVGLPDQSCSGADPGYRYSELQRQMETGASGSICDRDLAASYEAVALGLSDLGVGFRLSEPANPITLAVSVDGKSVAPSEDDGFSYESDSQTLYFNGDSTPPMGAVIEVTYSLGR